MRGVTWRAKSPGLQFAELDGNDHWFFAASNGRYSMQSSVSFAGYPATEGTDDNSTRKRQIHRDPITRNVAHAATGGT